MMIEDMSSHQNFDYANLPERFTREMGCDMAYLRDRLPAASNGLEIAWRSDGAVITVNTGKLTLQWHALEPRRIALMSAPRLHVSFAFECVPLDERITFMRYFDLYTRRGGG
jgi:hypothetical protein